MTGTDALALGIATRRMRALGLHDSEVASAGEVVEPLVAVQAQEHPVARWSVAQRVRGDLSAAEVDAAFDRGDLLRTHVLRPTWHYVAPSDLRWVMRFSGPMVHARNARRYDELGLDARTLARGTEVIAEAVRQRPRTRRELATVLDAAGLPADGQQVAYLVMHAELHLAVCSGPMAGKQHTYAAFDDRVTGDGPTGEEALATLARRYFTTRGPATVQDFAWWAGLRAADARRGLLLAAEHLEQHEVNGRTYAFADGAVVSPGRRVDLVQCYDEAIISYRESRDVLRSADVSFDTPARIDGLTHVILLDGCLLGHWRATRTTTGDSMVEVRLATAIDSATERTLAAAVERVRRFFAG